MEWWQTLLIASVPAAVTAAGLLLQQRSTARTERMRLADAPNEREHQRHLASDERAAQAAQREAERRASLDDHWRKERLSSHQEGLGTLQAVLTELRDLLSAIRESPQTPAPDLREMNERVQKPYPNVALFGSTRAAESYNAAVRSMVSVNVRATQYLMTVVLDDEEEKEKRKGMAYDALKQAQIDVTTYRNAARMDIGTDTID